MCACVNKLSHQMMVLRVKSCSADNGAQSRHIFLLFSPLSFVSVSITPHRFKLHRHRH